MINENNHLIEEQDPVKKPDVPDSPRPTSPEPDPDPPRPHPIINPIPGSEPEGETGSDLTDEARTSV